MANNRINKVDHSVLSLVDSEVLVLDPEKLNLFTLKIQLLK